MYRKTKIMKRKYEKTVSVKSWKNKTAVHIVASTNKQSDKVYEMFATIDQITNQSKTQLLICTSKYRWPT